MYRVRENASVWLLKLLQELREKIWGYILGGRTIHIKFAASH